MDSADCQQHSQNGTHGGEHKVLGQKLPHDPLRRCSQGHANRNFFLPAAGPCQLQVGDIGTGDQQHKSDCAKDSEKRYTLIAEKYLGERSQAKATIFVVNRMELLLAGRDYIHLGSGLGERDSIFKSSKNIQEVIVMIRKLSGSECRRHPDVGLP